MESPDNIINLSSEAPLRDRSFANYLIFEEIGQGGMGVVYRAQDLSLDRIVAIKVLREELRSHAHIVSRFQREARAAATLNHPNIVQIYSISAPDEVPYIAMEYIDGAALSTVMQGYLRIPWRQALGIAEQIAGALASAHHMQIIHRDIKPPNILIGRKGRAYITDFGIAKILTADTQLTVDGSRLGTPQYMSPERCRNEEVTSSSDIYSLGVVLFQMIAGTLPYQAATKVDMVQKILGEPPARLRQYVPDVPEDVERLVAHLIEKKPQDRPATAEAVAELIARVRAGRPLDEGGSQLASALAEFRDTMSARSSMATPLDVTTIAQEQVPAGVARFWRELPGALRFTLTAFAVALAGVGAGSLSAMVANHNRATMIVPAQDPTTVWEARDEVATFFDAADGVLRSQIAMPDFRPQTFGWGGNGSQAYVVLDGLRATLREGHRAVVALDPSQRAARLSIRPEFLYTETLSEPSIELLGFGRAPASGAPLFNRYLLRHSEFLPGRNAMRHTIVLGGVNGFEAVTDRVRAGPFTLPIETLDGVSVERIRAIAIDPTGNWSAVSLRAGATADSCVMGVWDGNPEYASQFTRVLTREGPPITSMQFSMGGDRIAYVRETAPSQRRLLVVRADGERLDGDYLAEGDLALHPDPFDPRQPAVVYSERSADGERRLRVVDELTATIATELGEGAMAAWHPSGGYLVATALDRRRQYQVWTIDRNPPHERRQLTFLSSGVGESVAVSADGAWAMTVENSHAPRLIFVKLDVPAADETTAVQ